MVRIRIRHKNTEIKLHQDDYKYHLSDVIKLLNAIVEDMKSLTAEDIEKKSFADGGYTGSGGRVIVNPNGYTTCMDIPFPKTDGFCKEIVK